MLHPPAPSPARHRLSTALLDGQIKARKFAFTDHNEATRASAQRSRPSGRTALREVESDGASGLYVRAGPVAVCAQMMGLRSQRPPGIGIDF